MGVCENVCCVAGCVRDAMGVVFYVFIVMRGAVGARVWEV